MINLSTCRCSQQNGWSPALELFILPASSASSVHSGNQIFVKIHFSNQPQPQPRSHCRPGLFSQRANSLQTVLLKVWSTFIITYFSDNSNIYIFTTLSMSSFSIQPLITLSLSTTDINPALLLNVFWMSTNENHVDRERSVSRRAGQEEKGSLTFSKALTDTSSIPALEGASDRCPRWSAWWWWWWWWQWSMVLTDTFSIPALEGASESDWWPRYWWCLRWWHWWQWYPSFEKNDDDNYTITICGRIMAIFLRCGGKVFDAERVSTLDFGHFHKKCFSCAECTRVSIKHFLGRYFSSKVSSRCLTLAVPQKRPTIVLFVDLATQSCMGPR